jgi:hypothetical protein
MIRNGNFVSKSRNLTHVVAHVAQSDHTLADGTFESVNSGAYDLTVADTNETISYTTRPSRDRDKSNMCNHVKNLTQYAGDPTSYVDLVFTNPGHVGHKCKYYGGHFHASAAHASAVGIAMDATHLNVSVNPSYYGDAQEDMDLVYASLKPDLTALSLPNFLLELDDLKALFELWKKKIGTVKNLAGAHLNYNFGWKPTLGDIRSMTDCVTGVLDKIAAFKRMANVAQRAHKSIINESTYSKGSFTYSVNHTCDWSASLKRTKRAELVYKPQPFKVCGSYELILRAYLDALGFELNPRIIWDALPFTFVIDWFFGIGSWLERHKYDTLELPIVRVDTNICYKEILQVESRLLMTSSVANPGTWNQPPWVSSRQFFSRVPVAPRETAFLGAGWRLPTLHQAELLVSLATVLARTK